MLHTPFKRFHSEHEARFVDFAGWEMPIMYRSIHEEHRCVREAGGMFDVSHMGRVRIAGPDARRLLERVCTRRVSDMVEGQCRYSLLCNDRGGTIDDILVYRFDEDWLLVVNASNREKVLAHLAEQAAGRDVRVDDETMRTAMVALQGPKVVPVIAKFSQQVPTLKRYRFCVKNLLGLKMTISRTGYTGEDGVEVIMPASMAPMAVKLLLGKAEQAGAAAPAGLGARDTLRMEAAMPLYGHELDEDTDPLSAGLAFAVSLDKDADGDGEGFIGQAALKKIAAEGSGRQLIGIKLAGKRTARQGMEVRVGDRAIGQVTSGCLSPTLGYPIAMAYVESGACGEGDMVGVVAGSRAALDGEVVGLPFYRCG